MEKSVLENLKYLDDSGFDRLNRHVKAGGDRQDRIFKMSEKKLEAMKMNEDKNSMREENTEIFEVAKHSVWVTPLKAAAACIAAVLIGVGVMGALKVGEALPSAQNYMGEVVSAKATKDQPVKTEGESSQTVSVSESVSSMSEKSESSTAESRREESAVFSDTQTHYPNIPAEISEPEQNAETQISDSSANLDTSDNGGNEPEAEIDVATGFAQKEQLLKVTDNMSYREVIELLGISNTPLYEGNYAEYIIDGEYLLMLKWDYDTDPILRDGKTLLESCPHISDMLNDPDSLTFDCYIVDFTGSSIMVTCPQYDFFSCAVVSIDNKEMREICDRAITDNAKVRIKHSGDVLESYPPMIFAESVEIVQ